MKEIPLSNGGVALVDDEDYEALSRWTWRRDYKGYARRTYYGGYYLADGKKKVRTMTMHRQIMGNERGVQYDHINGNKLDCRKSNLRRATNQQNLWNTRRTRGSSRFKGVMWRASRSKWRVKVKQGDRYLELGEFRNEEIAAMAYDDAVRKLRGEFARLNFPREGEQSAVA